MPCVSVILPTYNRAHLVREAIESVLNQTFADLELILVDDGSTDNTQAVVRSLSDPRVRSVEQPNQGASSARNTGLRLCAGEYVAFLDSDDLFLPQKLALQVPALEGQSEAGLVYGRYYSVRGAEAPRLLAGVCHSDLGLDRLLLGTAFHWSTVLIRRSWLDQVGGFDERLPVSEEWELTLRLALAGCRMVCLPQPVAVVRQQLHSLARDAYRHEAALVALLDEIFDNPRMPAQLRSLRNTAKAARLVRLAASAYLASQPNMGRGFLERALATDPTLADGNVDLLADLLVHRLAGLSLGDPSEMLRLVTSQLPGQQSFVRSLSQRLWGKFYVDAAFRSFQQGHRRQCINHALRAAWANPYALRNRGLLSILLRSMIGERLFDDLWHGQRRSEPPPS